MRRFQGVVISFKANPFYMSFTYPYVMDRLRGFCCVDDLKKCAERVLEMRLPDAGYSAGAGW